MNSRLLPSSLHRTLSLSVGLKALATATTFGVSVLLARVLGIEQYGWYAFWLSLMMLLVTPLQTGMGHLIVREASIALRSGAHAVAELALWASMWVCAIALLMCFVGVLVLYLLGEQISLSRDLGAVIAGVPLIFFVPLTAIVGSSVRALGGANWGQFPDRNMRPLTFLFLIAVTLIFSHDSAALDPTLAMTLHSAASAVAFVSAMIILIYYIKSTESSTRAVSASTSNPQLLRGAGSFALLAGLQLLNASIGVLVLGVLGSDADVGQFRVAAQLAGLTSFGLAAVNPALHSRFATLIDSGARNELQEVVSTGVQIGFIVAIPPVVIMLVVPSHTLSLLFGEQYALAATTLQILLVGQLANVVFGPVAALLNMGGYQRITIYALGASVLLNVFTSVSLWSAYGLKGVALGSVVGFLGWNFALWLAVKRLIGVNSACWFRAAGRERVQ